MATCKGSICCIRNLARGMSLSLFLFATIVTRIPGGKGC